MKIQHRQQNDPDIHWVGAFSGFEVGVSAEPDTERFSLYLATALRTYTAFAATALGACRSLEDKLKTIKKAPETYQVELESYQEELKRSLDLQQTPFALADELQAIMAAQETLNRDLGIKGEEELDAVAAALTPPTPSPTGG